MATFRTSAIVELIDKTKSGASSVLRNFGNLDKAAGSFSKAADDAAGRASKSFEEFAFEQKQAQDRLNDLRRDLREGRGDFRSVSREIDDVTESLERLNRENRGLRLARGVGRGVRNTLGATLRAVPIAGGLLAGAAGGVLGLTSNFATQADEAQRLADSVGVTIEGLTALQFVSGQLAGEDGRAALPDALKELNKRIGELRRGEGSLRDIDKRFSSILLSSENTEDAFVRLRQEIKDANLDSQQLGTLLDRSFGEAGFRLTALFQASNEEFAKLTQEARDVGLVLDSEAVEGARKFRREFEQIQGRVKAIGFQIGGAFAEPLANIFDEVLEPQLQSFQRFIGQLEPEDIERAFENVAGFLERGASAFGIIVDGVNAIGDFFEERERKQLQSDNFRQVRQERREREGFFDFQTPAETRRNFEIDTAEAARRTEEQLAQQREQTLLLRQIASNSVPRTDGNITDRDAQIDQGSYAPNSGFGQRGGLNLGEDLAFGR